MACAHCVKMSFVSPYSESATHSLCCFVKSVDGKRINRLKARSSDQLNDVGTDIDLQARKSG